MSHIIKIWVASGAENYGIAALMEPDRAFNFRSLLLTLVSVASRDEIPPLPSRTASVSVVTDWTAKPCNSCDYLSPADQYNQVVRREERCCEHFSDHSGNERQAR